MQNLEDLKEKIFFEAKNILDTLSKINSAEEFLQKKDLIEELCERVSFLKILEKNENYFVEDKIYLSADNQEVEIEVDEEETVSETKHEPVEEEVLFTNELNEIHKDEIDDIIETEANESTDPVETPEIEEVTTPEPEIKIDVEKNPDGEETPALENEISVLPEEEIPLVITESAEEDHLKAIEEKEKEFEESEERRRKIVEFEKSETEKPIAESADERLLSIQEEHREKAKKFHLANIKGLKSTVQSLFDDDPLEKIEEEKPKHNEDLPKEPSSLAKTNVPTDYMEAEKAKPEFRLDLNDRIAFTKTLFGGSQTDLNETMRTLNSFKTLEEAKEYLSDLYYDKNWEKADEYAQRLWALVENKFL